MKELHQVSEELNCDWIFRQRSCSQKKSYGTSSRGVFGGIGGSIVAIAFPHFPVESKIVGSLPPKFFSLGFLPIT